jgi:hypothetical protein
MQSISTPPSETRSSKTLRVFAPQADRVRNTDTGHPSTPCSFEELDVAFQNLTGWELRWNGEPPKGTHSSSRQSDHAWLSITDLSDRLPPGIHAQSRIYCENLIAKLNRLISEIRPIHNASSKTSGPPTKSRAKGSRRFQQPCFQELVSIVPLGMEKEGMAPNGSCDRINWYFRPSGVVVAGLFEVRGPDGLVQTGRTVAKAAFLSASRQSEDSKGLVDNIRSTFDQTFDSEIELNLLVWTLDPLLGLGSVCGDEFFQVELDGKPLKSCNDSSRGFVWLRGQKLIACSACEPQEPERFTGWRKCVDRSLGNYLPNDWQQALLEISSRAIPAITDMPELALAVVRN